MFDRYSNSTQNAKPLKDKQLKGFKQAQLVTSLGGLIAGLILLFCYFSGYYLCKASENWVQAQATLHNTFDSNSRKISYTYIVGDVVYNSRRIDFDFNGQMTKNRNQVWRTPDKSQIIIYHSLSSPENSVIYRNRGENQAVSLILGSLFLCAGLVVCFIPRGGN